MAETKPVSHPSKPQSPKPRQNPSKPVSSFLYKVILASVLIALLPIFPYPQSPELSNKSILARSWELLHLLLVGIAISYGLFSRRNSDPIEIDKETQVKIDMPQSYVSQILQVPSVFDDEEEVMSPKGLENQTWNYSQYYQKEPVVVVAEETTGGINSSSSKPLFLPVRNLKYRPHYNGYSVASNEVGGKIGGKEAFVLPSPIPWRSRSEIVEAKEESSSPHSPRCSASDMVFSSSRTPSFNSAVDAELGPSTTPSLRSSSPPAAAAAAAPFPKRPPSSPSPSSDSPEIRGKSSEDFGRKRSFNKSSPPLPPPPPPPSRSHHFTSEKRGAPKSFKDELTGKFLQSNGVARSARTVRSKQAQSRPRNQREKKDEFMERMIIPESDSESSNDDESELSAVPRLPTTETAEPEEENEVDKKADEFIAKFREQIRLQRIASIKKSSGQRNTINSN